MATLLLKKSYLINSLKEVKFKDLWGLHGVFTTIRLIDKPLKIIFLQSHLKNLINSSKTYKIYKKKSKFKTEESLRFEFE